MKYLLKKTILLPCFGLMLLLTSCPGPRSREVACVNGAIYLDAAGFNASDFTYGLVYEYKQDNLFDSVIDSQSFQLVVTGNDTFLLQTTYGPLTPGYDYKLVLPAINKTYPITHITQTGMLHATVSANTAPVCINRIASALVNGNTFYTDTPHMIDVVYDTPDTLIIER